MNFIELTITVLLKENIYFSDSSYIIAKNINKSMLLDEWLKENHPKKEYKNYVFNSFYPLERDKVYKKDKLYIFKIRSINKVFMEKLQLCLRSLESNDFNVISVAINEINQKPIKDIYTVTPVIVTIENKPWLQQNDIEVFKNRLEINLEKKYKEFFNEDITGVNKVIKSIEFKNRMPMHLNYKGIKLLGNKARIEIYDNEDAQKLAFMAMAVGLGEKNSAVGAGFCD